MYHKDLWYSYSYFAKIWKGCIEFQWRGFFFLEYLTLQKICSAQYSKEVTKSFSTFYHFWIFSNILIRIMYDIFGFWGFLMEKNTIKNSWVKPTLKEKGFLLHKIHFFNPKIWDCTHEHAYALWFYISEVLYIRIIVSKVYLSEFVGTLTPSI